MNSRKRRHRIDSLLLLIALSFAFASAAAAQQQERTLEEIKTEAIKRAENGTHPLIGLDPGSEPDSALRGLDLTRSYQRFVETVTLSPSCFSRYIPINVTNNLDGDSNFLEPW